MKLPQAWWMVGCVYYYNGKVVWCKDVPELKWAERYQDEATGAIRFHRGYFPDDGSSGETLWCQRMFMHFLLCAAEFYHRTFQTLKKSRCNNDNYIAQADRQPISLVGFNIGGFDILGVIQSFLLDPEWMVKGFTVTPVPKGSTTYIDFRLHYKNNTLLTMHDIMELVGSRGGLKKAHELYVRKPFANNPAGFIEEIMQRSECSYIYKQLYEYGFIMGKGVFPHFLTQREGFVPTLIDDAVKLTLEDFPRQYHNDIKDNPTFLSMNLRNIAWEYMLGDLCSTMATYLGFDVVTIQKMSLSCLKISTTQQLTTYRYLIHEANKKNKNHSVVKGDDVTKKNRFVSTNLPVYKYQENEFLKEAIYGGRTLPRMRYFESQGPDDHYFQGDVSGMYSWCQEQKPYPCGDYFYRANDATVQDKVMKQFRKAQQLMDSSYLSDAPDHSIFPHPFVARVRIRYPSLIIEPGVPYTHTTDGITWGISDESSETKGERVQVLCNVDLAIAMDDGAELLEVFEVMFWTGYKNITEDYVKVLNAEKYGDPDGKEFAKLCANSLYGSTLKQRKRDVQLLVEQIDQNMMLQLQKDIELEDCFLYYQPSSNICFVRGRATEKESDYSQRPTSSGVFVLAWSRWLYQRAIRIAYGDMHVPTLLTTKQDMRYHLQKQILYGDTDSVYFHKSHMDRILDYDNFAKDKILFEKGDKLDQLGKFTDEPAEKVNNYDPDFRAGKYVKLYRFASTAPKTYTAEYRYQGQVIYKSRCKGIPVNAARVRVSPLDTLQHQTPQEYTNYIPFKLESKALHEYMYFAMKNPNFYLESQCDQRIKRQSIKIGPGNFLEFKGERYEIVRPLDLSITNLDRSVCKDGETLRYKKRRLLTQEEISFLDLSDDDARRITVPLGWNYDRMLFELIDETASINEYEIVKFLEDSNVMDDDFDLL
jgi:hypothetical protein